MPTFSALELAPFAKRLLVALNVTEPRAALVAESLLAANLRGVDSHGLQLLQYYIEQLESGDMDARAEGHVVSENGACLVFDGENGLGQGVADVCTDHAVRLAREHGIAMVVSNESNHFGACAWWAQKISRQGMIGIVTCNASPIVPPWQGKESRIGTNPICFSVPGPFLLDMATTTVAAGKIFKASINGNPVIPQGWAMDSEGVPTTDTATAMKGLLMPLGGYKGSGLAMMVEILCSVLSGGAMATEIGGIRWRGTRVRNSQNFIAIDIARFMPVEEFQQRIEKLVGTIKTTPASRGYDEVLVAGDPEWRTEAERLQTGVPIGEGTWKFLIEAAGRLGVPVF